YQCSPQHSNSPLYPATEQLAVAAGIEPADDASTKAAKLRGALGAVPIAQLPLIANLMGVSLQQDLALADMTPSRRRQLTLEAFTTQLEALCRERPVLWVVEDAHWID